MRETRPIMGMPITVEVVGSVGPALRDALEESFHYFTLVDELFSTYKPGSEIMRINRGEITQEAWSGEIQEVFDLAEKTKQESRGFFDIKKPDGTLDPSGIVKGWAINNAADILHHCGFKNFSIEAGGDIQTNGTNAEGLPWSVGIQHPTEAGKIIKVLYPRGQGVATSGSYTRGNHIYNPHEPQKPIHDILSITVIGLNILEADRFATAAFAMGKPGIEFIESVSGLEGYMVDSNGIATMTTQFEALTNL